MFSFLPSILRLVLIAIEFLFARIEEFLKWWICFSLDSLSVPLGENLFVG